MKHDYHIYRMRYYINCWLNLQTKLLLIWQQYGLMVRQFLLLSLSTLLVRGAHVICMPLTLRLVSPTDYGVLALMNSFIAISSACMGLGLRQCLPLYYFERNHADKKLLINHVIGIYLLLAPVVGMLVGALFVRYALPETAVPWYMICCAGGISFCMFFVELCYQLLQYHQQIAYLTLLQIVQALCTIGCTFAISLYTMYSFCAPLIAQTITIAIMSLIACCCWMQTAYGIHMVIPTWQTMRTYLVASICFLPSMLFGWVLAACQRWLVAHYLGLADVGIYAVADGLCQLSHLVCTYAMVGSHMPHMLQKFVARPRDIVSLEQENRIVMWCAMLAAVLLLIVAQWLSMPLLRFIVHENFAQALQYLFPLLIGSIFLMGAHFLSPLLQHKKQSIYLGCSLIVPAIANIALGILLVPRMGLYGAVIAQVSAYIGYFCMNLWYNQRLLNAERNAPGCNGS